jgi:dihydrofolate reductase
MRLTATMFQTLDGVVQGPGGPSEDRSGGFDRGGWLAPYADEGMNEVVTSVFGRAAAFLLGRRTYDIFAAYWPSAPREVDGAPDVVAQRLADLPKHVVSTTLTDPAWAGTEVVGRDGADVRSAVERLKEAPPSPVGDELQVHGSPTLVDWLVAQGLLDELRLLTFPVVLGHGARLFPTGSASAAFTLGDVRRTGSGIVVTTYRPAGRPVYRSVDA